MNGTTDPSRNNDPSKLSETAPKGQQKNNERLLRVQEVSQKLAVRDSWVYAHAAELGGVRLFGLLRFRESHLDKWINEQTLAAQG